MIEQLAGLTQDTRTPGADFVMEGATVLEKGNCVYDHCDHLKSEMIDDRIDDRSLSS